ncbi:MAG: hypothetical protein AABY22_32285 [Nanoarchaeota archaeon]
MEQLNGTEQKKSGLQPISELIDKRPWIKYLPQNYKEADYKSFKYGIDESDNESIIRNPILGFTTVDKLKEAENVGAIVTKKIRNKWIWAVKKEEAMATKKGGDYEKGDMITVVSPDWFNWKEKEKMRESARKFENEAVNSLIKETEIKNLPF